MDDEFNYKKEHSRSKHSIDRLLDGTKSWCPREPQRWRYAAKELSTSNLSAPTRIRNRISRTQEKGTKSRSLPALSTTEPAPGSILISNKRLLATTNKSIDLNVLVGEGRWTMSLTTKKSSKLTEKRRNWLVCNSVIWGKNIGGGSYLGGRATLSISSFFGRWFQVEGIMDVGFSILWQERTKIEKRFWNLMFVQPACAHS
jgi:hypothetical protein